MKTEEGASLMSINEVMKVLECLRLLRNKIAGIKTENAWVRCSINDDWNLKVDVIAYSLRNNRYRIKLGGMIDFEIEDKIPEDEVGKILGEIFEILRAPELKNPVLKAYLTQKNGISIKEEQNQ